MPRWNPGGSAGSDVDCASGDGRSAKSESRWIGALARFVALDGEFPSLARDRRTEPPQDPEDGSTTGVIVGRMDVERALRRYEEGRLSAERLERWAELLEMQDAVHYERGHEATVADFLFRLATPEVHEPLTPTVVGRMRAELRARRTGGTPMTSARARRGARRACGC